MQIWLRISVGKRASSGQLRRLVADLLEWARANSEATHCVCYVLDRDKIEAIQGSAFPRRAQAIARRSAEALKTVVGTIRRMGEQSTGGEPSVVTLKKGAVTAASLLCLTLGGLLALLVYLLTALVDILASPVVGRKPRHLDVLVEARDLDRLQEAVSRLKAVCEEGVAEEITTMSTSEEDNLNGVGPQS